MDKPVNPPRDTQVAGAINRVLEAERAAETAIHEAERRAEERLERARARRRALIARAQSRITALHGSIAQRLDETERDLRERAQASAGSESALRIDCVQESLQRLAAVLTVGAAEGDDEGP